MMRLKVASGSRLRCGEAPFALLVAPGVEVDVEEVAVLGPRAKN